MVLNRANYNENVSLNKKIPFIYITAKMTFLFPSNFLYLSLNSVFISCYLIDTETGICNQAVTIDPGNLPLLIKSVM